eukprot:6243495-Amphidinium_carterae.1
MLFGCGCFSASSKALTTIHSNMFGVIPVVDLNASLVNASSHCDPHAGAPKGRGVPTGMVIWWFQASSKF